MATITPNKTRRSLQSSASNAAAATATGTGIDITGKDGGLATLIVTNGGAGPTVGCTARLEHSSDNSNWYELQSALAPVTNSLVTVFNFDVHRSVMYLRSVFTGNTAQAVTVEAFFQENSSYTSA